MSNATQDKHEAEEFYELAKDEEPPLYEGCTKYSRLSFLVKLHHIKCGMSHKAMTMILELLNDAFGHAKIPSSFCEAKKIIPHTFEFDSKTVVRNRDEVESQQYTKEEMYPNSHRKKDGSFVNEAARQEYTSSKNKAFARAFEKEHPEYVGGMELGVTPSHDTESISHSTRSVSSSESVKMRKLQVEINALKDQVAQVDVLKEQVDFLMQNVKGNKLGQEIQDLRLTLVMCLKIMEHHHGGQFKYFFYL
ncbi:hypothetical protein GmHk_20G056604 [Glycine max]|uniref:uncharacterized protein LOC114402914 isoform X1 n=1 Tax=Glycine soja TaxID=3848 RepID=UPI00103C64E1|nr:uncharacterized protein LOC114402914 isoform X1 [Glycine soja]XP_028221404.1 uncharacterized protein LOC114402914 isoform X1 [Glycine soja]XP_028221405.1 uncharacterized protein LOC114402914 isoform X1 [Glycine soja]KAH1188673.1 hypothetical protein GmHk_20G056604 [Glycine max]